MIRKIIDIDREKCNGCGLCVSACHEGAIAIVDGKAELIRDDYSDGLGNVCGLSTGAITFIEREAAAYYEVLSEYMRTRQRNPLCPIFMRMSGIMREC
jgi:ferredoxin